MKLIKSIRLSALAVSTLFVFSLGAALNLGLFLKFFCLSFLYGFFLELCDFILEIVIQNFAGLYEQIFDILASHSGCFERVQDSFLLLKLFDSFLADFSFVLHIEFVAY